MAENMVFTMAGLTDIGRRRKNNEDAYRFNGELGYAIVADGMGGYHGGELASRIATNEIASSLTHAYADAVSSWNLVEPRLGVSRAAIWMRQQVIKANQAVIEAAAATPDCPDMGTTLVAALFYQTRLCLAHVGDSRCYRLRDDRLLQLTRDHSYLQDQLDSGLITPEEAKAFPYKNLVTRALGAEAVVEPEISEYRIQQGDRYLLCTDGVTDLMEAELILATIKKPLSLEAQAKAIIELANERGGYDNITVVIIAVDKAPS